MDEKKDSMAFAGGATPTVTTKKVPPPGKKKVIRRLVKNAKTGEVIKTEIVRIDSNGETTITSYPAGTPVPNLQPSAAGRRSSRTLSSPSEKKEATAESPKPTVPRADVGPSVPANMAGLEDLLEKEKQILKAREEAAQQAKPEPGESDAVKKNEENLEAALISIARRKRQKDPKARRRGLAASTMPRRADSDDNEDKDHLKEDTDYRAMQTNADDEEEMKKKERHRRRRERRHREKPAAYRDKEANDSGIDGAQDQRPYDPEDEDQELHPLEEAELLAKQLQASASLKHQKEAEQAAETPVEVSPPVEDKPPQMSEISDDELDDKPKKKHKKKHKKQKKKKKKQRRRDSDDDVSDKSDRERQSSPGNDHPDRKEVGLKKEDIDAAMRSRSRSRSHSFSSLTLSSISSDFSDSFDFAEVNPMSGGDSFRGGFRGRGTFNVPFRGRGVFRGFPVRGRPPRGGFRGGWAGFPGMFPEGAVMDPMGNPMFMGRGGRGMWPRGPWGPMMGGGRGGFNNTEEGGIGIYVEDESDSKRSRSYSSYSSYSSRSHSRSRRRHRRRHRSSSRSYSSYSRSSRSYSRSYSRSSRSYSRSYSRSTSRSYSSYSRSRSRSRSKGSSSSGRSRSPHFRDIYSQGAAVEAPKQQEEEVPWWAEFDKTYELQKQADKEAKLQAKSQASKEANEQTTGADASAVDYGTKLQGTSYDIADMAREDIDVVRTVMSLVDKASHDQDPDVEDARRCILQLLDEVCSAPHLQSPESAAQDCMNSLLDQLCPDDPLTIARQDSLDQNVPHFPQIADDDKSKLLRWYTIACHVTKQTRAMRHQAQEEKTDDDKDSRSEGEHKKSEDRKGRRSRRRRRRRRHRGRSYSRSSYSSSSSEKRPNLVNLTEEQQKSLQQAQQLLVQQQQQLQAAGILPQSLALPNLSMIPNLLPATSTNASVAEPEVLSQRWDKEMDALLKTKSKDDITRKLMQRMKEKKQLGESDDASPFNRSKSGDILAAEKVFSGSGLKSRKIAISSIDKSKVFDEIAGYKKSDIAAAHASIEEATSRDNERLRALEQRGRLEAWSDEQRSLKEEVKRKMREEIEKAERAKKEMLKEQMLEEEKQREIMRIREEVREQIQKEIRDEIAKQRKEVLEDPDLKSQLMELEALRQSKVLKGDSSTKPYIKPLEESFVMDKDKHKKDMNQWLEQHGKSASDMGVDEMRKMQMVYMEQLHHWSQQQQKAYMAWYWHQQQHHQQHTRPYNQAPYYNQQKSGVDSIPPHEQPRSSGVMGGSSMSEAMLPDRDMKHGSTFTHAPSQAPHRDDTEGTTRTIPPRGVMSSHADAPNMHSGVRPNMQTRPQFPNRDQFNRMPGNYPPNGEMMPRRGLPPNQQRFNVPMHPQDMQRMRRPFPDHREQNQAPMHQYPPPEFDRRQQEDFQSRMPTPVSGMRGPSVVNRFERPPFDNNRGGPRFDGLHRPRFDGHRHPGPPHDQRAVRPFDQRMRPPFDQQQQQQQQHPRPQFDQHMRPQMHAQFDPRGPGPLNQHLPPHMQNQGPVSQPMMSQAGPPLGGHPGPQQIVTTGQPPLVRNPMEENVPMKMIRNDQPPPPGVDTNITQSAVVTAPPGVEELQPPGEETTQLKMQEPMQNEEVQESETAVSKPSKKKKKKHRKHKKRRERSSSSDNDDDAQHDAIVKQLEALQAVEEGEVVEVEDGEVQSDDEKKPSAIAAAAALLKQLKAREKKRHKKRKKKRRASSSEEESQKPTNTAPSGDISGLPPPPFFQEVVPPEVHREMQGLPPHAEMTRIETVDVQHPMPTRNELPPMKIPHDDHHFPPSGYRGSPFAPHIQQAPERFSLPPNPQGAGEPHLGGSQPVMDRNDHFTHYIGPGGDHTLGQNPSLEQKRSQSPLPMVIPDDPREMEMWAQRMSEKYADEVQDVKPPPEFTGVRKVEKIPSLMEKYIPEPEARRTVALAPSVRGSRRDYHGGRQRPDDDRGLSGKRKMERGGRGRGRKRKRGMGRNYHDWDQPADDGLIYYYSDSDNSSGWGSDKNFDDLLAKKKRESLQKSGSDQLGPTFTSPPRPIHVTNTRRPSPGPRDSMPGWDRLDHMGEPQGIPVIGGVKPQPIPSLANRGGLARSEYDGLGRPMSREDEFKMQPDYWIGNDQQAMLRNPSQWEPQAGGAREPTRPAHWPRPTMR